MSRARRKRSGGASRLCGFCEREGGEVEVKKKKVELRERKKGVMGEESKER